MHIPDGFLSPTVAAGGFAAAGGLCALAIRRASRSLGERQVPLLGMTAAFVFAAQMLNFPIGLGTSGHFLGATLASVLLGPLNAVLVMAVVLCIQAFGFADGGVSALGANIVNMGVVPMLVYYVVFAPLNRLAPASRKMLFVAGAAAAWLSILSAAAACAAELALSGTFPLLPTLGAMLFYHALIGAGEAAITAAVLGVVLGVRPDLVSAWRQNGVALAQAGEA